MEKSGKMKILEKSVIKNAFMRNGDPKNALHEKNINMTRTWKI